MFQYTYTRALALRKIVCFEGGGGRILTLLTLYLSNIGSHRDWTIFRTTRALSREHCILNTLGVGHGISDKKQMSITYTSNTKQEMNGCHIWHNYMLHSTQMVHITHNRHIEYTLDCYLNQSTKSCKKQERRIVGSNWRVRARVTRIISNMNFTLNNVKFTDSLVWVRRLMEYKWYSKWFIH